MTNQTWRQLAALICLFFASAFVMAAVISVARVGVVAGLGFGFCGVVWFGLLALFARPDGDES